MKNLSGMDGKQEDKKHDKKGDTMDGGSSKDYQAHCNERCSFCISKGPPPCMCIKKKQSSKTPSRETSRKPSNATTGTKPSGQ